MGLRLLLLYTFFSVNYFSISATFCTHTYDSRCSYDQICCNDVCVYGSSCVGHYCILDSDCAFSENCCDNTCKYSCVEVGAIIGTVFSILFGIVLICVIVICCRRRRLHSVHRPIVGQRVTTRTTTTTTQNYRPVPNYAPQGPYQQPYGYQQGYVQPPVPPPYPGYGAINPVAGAYQSGSNPATQPNMAAAQPPPYEETPAVVNVGKGNTDQKNNYSQATAPPM